MQAKRLNYKGIISEYFRIKNKKGEVVPFVFNDTQNYYYELLKKDYPEMQGIRENDLKFRQPGFSSLIDAMFMVDFIWSELGRIPLVDADIVSHKDKETKVLFDRASFFLDSYLEKVGATRKEVLDVDTNGLLRGKRGSQLYVQTASARVSGRGGTKQNIHWSEVAFYSNTAVLNARTLITGAEQQVADGIGKIFRESTGNISDDFFSDEYEAGKIGRTEFKSRFFGWYIHHEYSRNAPADWVVPAYYKRLIESGQADRDQCFWHYMKTGKLEDKEKLREYPTYDFEAFLLGGESYFSTDAVISYLGKLKEPLKEGVIML
ncbi:MAG: hypothetical protein C5B59_12945 [Bacteroidetes bacterium]|nr:MAG: hypothetical protein C5B59_12945 [Bacteroidota bacterium]